MPRAPRLTRATVRALRPGQRASAQGITVERLAAGDRRYTVAIRVDGQRVHRVIGLESEGVTLTQAEQFIARVRTEARTGRLQLPRGRKVSRTIAQAATDYLRRLEATRGNDVPKKRARLQQHIVPLLGKVPLDRLSPFDLERFKAARLKRGAQPATVNRDLSTLSHLYSMAIDWGWVSARPVKIALLAEENARTTYLTVAEITRLLAAALHHENPQLYPFVRIALGTSMRRGEILRLQKHDVDLQRHLLHIPQAKSGPREQPMTADLVDYLTGYIASLDAEIPWLFPSARSQSGHTENLFWSWRSLLRDAGLNPTLVVRHTLRHTVITHLVQAGVDLPTVQRISGHKDLSMVLRYAHQSGTHIQEAMETLAKRLHSGEGA